MTSSYEQRKINLRKNLLLYEDCFGGKWFYQRTADGVEVVNEFVQSREESEKKSKKKKKRKKNRMKMKQTKKKREKTANFQEGSKKTMWTNGKVTTKGRKVATKKRMITTRMRKVKSERKTTNRRKVAMMEKRKLVVRNKKHWRKLKANTMEKKRTPQQMRYPNFLRARGKIKLAVAGSDRRQTYALGHGLSCQLFSLVRHRYKSLSRASAFPFDSVSFPWLDDDPSTKGQCSLVIFHVC